MEDAIVVNIDEEGIAVVGLIVYKESEEGVSRQALYSGAPTGDRGRLLWEATRAMVGPNEDPPVSCELDETQADCYPWYTSDQYGIYAYVSEDSGAWNTLRYSTAYSLWDDEEEEWIYGWYVACRRTTSEGDLYQPCSLYYGSFDNLYAYDTHYGSYRHGGQCKSFTNLVAWRSSIFHGEDWAFSPLPTDGYICERTGITQATSNNIQAGDVLRMPDGHSAIIARIFGSSQVVVVDSNWVGGNGYERIASHSMNFSGSGIDDLGNYFRLDCVYDNDCDYSVLCEDL